MTLEQLYRNTLAPLVPLLGAGEAAATARLLLEDDLGVDRATLLAHGDRPVEPETVRRFYRYTRRILAGEPPQYLTGKARFMGMTLHVDADTLIPRPETAELVDLVCDTMGDAPDRRVCDLGTGSGCIAIALSRRLPFARVTAVDISPGALAVARQNAAALHARIEFVEADMLSQSLLETLPGPFDTIVSNPPYIAPHESADMDVRVKAHEPARALFAPEADPLAFYRAILDYAGAVLAPGAYVFFEINPLFAAQLAEMCRHKGYSCLLARDSYGKQRFATCRKL